MKRLRRFSLAAAIPLPQRSGRRFARVGALYIWDRYGYTTAISKFLPKYKAAKGHVKKGNPDLDVYKRQAELIPIRQNERMKQSLAKL